MLFIESCFSNIRRQLLVTLLPTLLLITQSSFSLAQTDIYKYQDSNGNWVFSDRKPKQKSETISLKNTQRGAQHEPWLEEVRHGEQRQLFLNNPVHAPIIFVYRSHSLGKKRHRYQAPGAGRFLLQQQSKGFGNLESAWLIGDGEVVHQQQVYQLPFKTPKRLLVTQGFNGRFSHQGVGNRNAIDIAMEMGTDIAAARDGTVAIAKDDYHMGGARRFFLDKANHITIYHDDGSTAIYAHILQGSAKVKAGDKIRAGQVIARSGSSGYSTGPHLHFVVRGIKNGRLVSFPFQLKGRDGKIFTPRARQKI